MANITRKGQFIYLYTYALQLYITFIHSFF